MTASSDLDQPPPFFHIIIVVMFIVILHKDILFHKTVDSFGNEGEYNGDGRELNHTGNRVRALYRPIVLLFSVAAA